MESQVILILYLILFSVKFIWESLLNILNQRYIIKHKESPPKILLNIFDLNTIEKSVDYTVTKARFGLFTSFFTALLLLLVILSGFLGWLQKIISYFHLSVYTSGVVFYFSISILFSLFSLPFSIYSQFVIEERFGFNRMTFCLFFLDLIKSLFISIILITPLLYLIFWFMDTAGAYWWIYAFAGTAVFQFILLVIYPTVIAPIFNKFKPIEDEELKAEIQKLAEKVNFKTKGIFVMDGSKRSSHSNAYFTGLGKAKRIVLFDTLIEQLSVNGLLGVLAHEMGHEKKRHILTSLIFSVIGLFIGFWLLSLILPCKSFFQAFGFEGPGYAAAIVLMIFCAGPFTFILTPLMAFLSRRKEYKADRFAVEATGKEGLKEALIQLSRKNLSNLLPHPLYSFYYYSHPTLLERIEAIDKL